MEQFDENPIIPIILVPLGTEMQILYANFLREPQLSLRTQWGDPLSLHMGAEAPYSFKEVSGGPPHCKLTTRHHIFWYHVSPNQTCKVLEDFGPKS